MAVRIKDLTTTASEAAADDYIALDGATNGTRKILASDVGGGGSAEYDFTSSLTPSIDSRGVSMGYYAVTPTNADDITVANATKIRGYLENGTGVYPLITVYAYVNSYNFMVHFKSIYASTQATSSSTVSGTLHIVAPFEISNVIVSM